MDGKKQEGSFQSRLRRFASEYLGIYTEGPAVTGDEVIKKLPKYLYLAAEFTIYAGLGYLFGAKTMAYSSLPLGTAFLCSLRKGTSPAYLGLLVSAVTETTGMSLPLFLIYTAVYMARILIFRSAEGTDEEFGLFNEKLLYRMAEGFSASLLISVYRAGAFGFLEYDILGGVFEIITVPVLIYVYDLAFNKKYMFTSKREFGRVLFLSMAVFAVRDVYFLGLSVGIAVVLFITLYVSKSAGMMRGGVYGLLCGLACNVAFSPVFAICGIVSGILWNIGSFVAVSVSCVAGILCGIYVEGWQSLSAFAPDIIGASVIFGLPCYYGFLPDLVIYGEKPEAVFGENTSLLAEKKQKDTEARFEALSNAFSDLSEVFYTLSDRIRRPGIVDTRQICDDVCDRICTKCAFHRVCWDREYSSTQDVFSKIAGILHNGGYVDRTCVASYMVERCRNIDKILNDINDEHALLVERLIMQNKTEIFAMDYESMAHLLDSAVKSSCEEYTPDPEMCKKLRETQRHMALYAKNVCVFGKRKITVLAGGVDLSSVKMSANEIRSCYENICGVKLTTPKFDVDGDYITMSLETSRQFKVEYAAAASTKKDENFCGDMICMFENGHDYFYSLISDGMGSGREAALTSRLCAIFLKKMLMAGNSKPVSMEMLNNFIRSKNTECFATVDLLEIDMLNGKAGFVKSGAVSSYVLRDGKIFRISSNTMPVGITRVMNAEEVKFDLKDNDVIVMVSDGVGQSDEETVRVSDILTYSWENDLQKMADKILRNAIAESLRSDDVSVGVIRVKTI